MTSFQAAMKFVSKWEWQDRPDGAYTNDPKDPGGETKFGIAKNSHPNENIKDMTLARALDIYYQEYWTKFNLDSLAYPFSVAVFDSYVQHRPSVVQTWLKLSANDIQKLLENRRIFYLNLVGKFPSRLRFKNGWLARLNDLSKYVAILTHESEQIQVASNGGASQA